MSRLLTRSRAAVPSPARATVIPAVAQDRAGLLRRFAERLEEVRLAAGKPPYADLTKRSQWLKRATISDVLRGRSNPSLDFVVAFVDACRAVARPRLTGSDPDLFDVDKWQRDWLELQRQLGTLRRANPSPTGSEDHPAPAGSPLPVPRQLPAPPYPFIGREAYVEALDAMLAGEPAQAGNRGPSALAVDGPAGIGKTALVVHWAHRVLHHYPDGDLYLDLRGYGPGHTPIPPAEALRTLLQALQLPPARIPEDTDQLSALWRTMLAERRLLVILDNARSAAQVRPLLPGVARSTVVVTSRRRLSGLLVRDGAGALGLAPMTATESQLLMRATLGEVAGAEPDVSQRLAGRCGHNPLAIRILVERIATRPRPLTEVLRELGAARPLDALATADEDEPAAVRNVLGWSYRALPDQTARVFRLLSVHPGPHLCRPAAAALAGVPVARAEVDLAELRDLHLVLATAHTRYQLHDLVRDLATELLTDTDGPDQRRAAMRREALWYLHSAAEADRRLMPGRRRFLDRPPPAGLEPMTFAGYDDALAWCDAERDNLVGVVRQAAEQHWYEICWRLPTILLSYFNLRKAWAEWVASFDIGLAAAQALADRRAEAMCANALGIAHRELGHTGTALDHFNTAAGIFRELRDDEGESTALNNIGVTYQDDHRNAAVVLRRAFDAARSGGSLPAELTALHNLGEAYLGLGRFGDALACARRCLEISEQVADQAGVGFALTSLGEIYARQRRWDEAIGYLRAGLRLRSRVGDLQGEAVALFRLGRALAGSDDELAARDALRAARERLEWLGDPLAAEVRAFQRRM